MISIRTKKWLEEYYDKMKAVHKLVCDKAFWPERYLKITGRKSAPQTVSKDEMYMLNALKTRVQLGIASQIYFWMVLPIVYITRRMFKQYALRSLLLFVPGILLAGTSAFYELKILRKYEQNIIKEYGTDVEKYKK